MKSQLLRTSSILAGLILLVALSLTSTAQEPRTRQQQPAQQEELQIRELAVQEIDSETLRVALPHPCYGMTPVVQIHGNHLDNFNPPGPVALSPALTTYIGANNITPKGYDDKTINKVFADSFKLQSCKICYATIEYRVRHQAGPFNPILGNYSNDTILAGVAPFAPPSPNRRFIGPTGIWASDVPYTKTATLGISPANLADLNSYIFSTNNPHFLDIVAQDDTDFDYIKLSVWY